MKYFGLFLFACVIFVSGCGQKKSDKEMAQLGYFLSQTDSDLSQLYYIMEEMIHLSNITVYSPEDSLYEKFFEQMGDKVLSKSGSDYFFEKDFNFSEFSLKDRTKIALFNFYILEIYTYYLSKLASQASHEFDQLLGDYLLEEAAVDSVKKNQLKQGYLKKMEQLYNFYLDKRKVRFMEDYNSAEERLVVLIYENYLYSKYQDYLFQYQK